VWLCGAAPMVRLPWEAALDPKLVIWHAPEVDQHGHLALQHQLIPALVVHVDS
jgi:hypothetical protein